MQGLSRQGTPASHCVSAEPLTLARSRTTPHRSTAPEKADCCDERQAGGRLGDDDGREGAEAVVVEDVQVDRADATGGAGEAVLPDRPVPEVAARRGRAGVRVLA